MKSFYLLLAVFIFNGCGNVSKPSEAKNYTYKHIILYEGCADGLVVYRDGYNYPAMYKRDINDKLIPCDSNKFKKD